MAQRDPQPVFESNNALMARAFGTARRVAGSDVPVLLTGESGTGKHVLASAIHRWSGRRGRPFVTAPRTAFLDAHHEGELFPYFDTDVRDPYAWLSAADGGVLFFEELSELSLIQQARLVPLVEDHRFQIPDGGTLTADARVIAATSCDPEAEVRAGRLREDLFFRLTVVTIALPPLRRRREDLASLSDHFLETLATRYGRSGVRLTNEVRQAFARYEWPGNVRELQNTLERAVVLSHGEAITIEDLPERLHALVDPPPGCRGPASLHELERSHIARAIQESPTLEDAAIRLGIDPATLWRKRKRYGLE